MNLKKKLHQQTNMKAVIMLSPPPPKKRNTVQNKISYQTLKVENDHIPCPTDECIYILTVSITFILSGFTIFVMDIPVPATLCLPDSNTLLLELNTLAHIGICLFCSGKKHN